jgi:hypothetical protein
MAKITLYMDVPKWKINNFTLHGSTSPYPECPEWCKRLSVDIELPDDVWKESDQKLPSVEAVIFEQKL